MDKQVRNFGIFFYCSILTVLIAGAFGCFEGLYAAPKASPKVVQTFEAGPIKADKKQVVKVQTHFEWSQKKQCQCPDHNDGPCIKTFLDKDLPSETPKYLKRYNKLEQNSDKYQGSNLVPTGIEYSSVRILVFPFCSQEEK